MTRVEEVLAGKRYKFLDPTRKAVLMLPPNALKLWLAYWMFESDDRKAYPTQDTIDRVTGMSTKTIIKARAYLLAEGWLKKCSGSAADYYTKATRGAHKVGVYRVADPTGGETPPRQVDKVEFLHHDIVPGGNVIPPKTPHNGVVAFVVDVEVEVESITPSKIPVEMTDQPEKQKPKPTDKWLEFYTETLPVRFYSFPLDAQAVWLDKHVRAYSGETGRFQCPGCEFNCNSNIAMAKHLASCGQHQE